MSLSAPEPLAAHHHLASFHCGEPSLDDWLKKRALPNQTTGASRTFVIHDENNVAGYYALASASVLASEVPGRFRRNMPDPIPVILLGRLAIDRNWQGNRLGSALFKDAALRVSQAADSIGVRGILVHALSDNARKFYLSLGFVEYPHEPLSLVIMLQDLRLTLI